MTRISIFTLFILCSGYPVLGQDADFTYGVAGHIKSPNFFAVEAKPFNMYFQGMFMGVGAGGRIQMSDIQDRFSMEGEGVFNFINYSLDKNRVFYSTDQTLKVKSTFEGSVKFGYTIKRVKKKVEASVRMKGNNRFQTVAILPIVKIHSYTLTAGYNMRSMYNTAETRIIIGSYYNPDLGQTVITDKNGYFRFRELNQNVTVGIKRRCSVQSVFKTDVFGVRTESVENEIYADVLVNLASTIPNFYAYDYSNPFYPNEVSGVVGASQSDRESLLSTLKKLPVGFRVGIRNGSRNVHGVIWNAHIGFNPGSYTGILELGEIQIGIAYRFLKEL